MDVETTASKIVGEPYAATITSYSLQIYKAAHAFAYERGVIIADTKFEFGLDAENHQIILVDEILTPDSSRFWPRDSYETGRSQDSFDKQFLRDWLVEQGLKGKEGVRVSDDVIKKTSEKYKESWEIIAGR